MSTEADLRIWAHEEDHASQRRKLVSRWGIASIFVVGALFVMIGSARGRVRGSLSETAETAKLFVDSEEESPAPRYNATQFISFTINTFGGLAEHGECSDHEVDANGVCYLGSYNITEDVIHRSKIVRGVLEALKKDVNRKNPEIDHRDDVLKIFAMPEFFWRGPFGAYTHEQIESVVLRVFDAIREDVSDQAFTHYLFILGTVIAINPHKDETAGKSLGNTVQNAEYGNFCPVYKGGPTHRHKFLITKKYISTVDFLNRTTLPNPRNFDVTEYKHKDFSDRFNSLMKMREVEIVSDNVIHMDGLTIGIEVCLDHRMGALWDNLQKYHDSELVDVLVITSAGMAIERGPNPVMPGGAVYLCDGTASSAACLRSDHGDFNPEDVCRAVKPDGIKHVPNGGPGYSEFFTVSACIDMEKLDFLEGYYSLYQTQGCAYTLKLYGVDVMDEYDYYPPSIEIYPVVDLPKNAYEINH